MGIPCTLFPNNFNPRPREGSDRIFLTAVCLQSHFNPRPREGSDTVDNLTPIGLFAISIHAPARGATILMSLASLILSFQSTPPRGERPPAAVVSQVCSEFQSTPPRGERPPYSNTGRSGRNFNPRPREGSDARRRRDFSFLRYFNPRPREGSDEPDVANEYERDEISIHAPARGATIPSQCDKLPTIFQSTPPRGERHISGFQIQSVFRFQSTSPRGERLPSSRPLRRTIYYFNPRPREGSDACHVSHRPDCSAEFQSTPPRGERLQILLISFIPEFLS